MNQSNRNYHRTQLHHRQEAIRYRGMRYHHHEVHALFDELIHRRWGITCWTPPVDIWESDAAYVIDMDLPGVDAGEVRIEAYNKTLAIEGQRHVRHDANEATARLHERCEGKFGRTFEFEFNIEEVEITRDWQDGALTLTVPKPKKE
jgi:HSP20 family protein